ncbi:sugar translocase [Massilia sp. RP-1-19]|uniref:Sugar translocase n=1 Tax=Massilia polaris TaxID=2728846 RepID=A0A848HL21_9BURK|nr:sugar translocase [Massilia polaris]NML62586.1 sugar translocase [Massilia polaris]
MNTSMSAILRAEWRWWLPGAALSMLLASVLLSGWPAGLLPGLGVPLDYHHDSLSHAWLVQRAIEGWIFDNPRSGYPFGSNFLDYPGADGASLVLLKLLGLPGWGFQAAMTLYFLGGFGAIFAAAYGAMRAQGLARPLALSAALLFNFAPFHFQRAEHIFLTFYVAVPLFFHVAMQLWRQPPRALRWRDAGLVALGSTGVYYAFFGLLVVATAALARLVRGWDGAVVRRTLAVMSLVLAGVLVNVAPNLAQRHPDGPNMEVAQRGAHEAELLGFKFAQLVMPRIDHRIERWNQYALDYYKQFPLSNENVTSNLGAVASAGLAIMLCAVFAALAGRKVAPPVALLALVVLMLFMFGTAGGFGSLFSQIVSASLRGWNRISIFIAFGALLGGFLVLQGWIRGRGAVVAVAIVLAVAGLLDQTAAPSAPHRAAGQRAFALDRDFVGAIEKSLPAGSAVYQLPYMGFPEVGPRERMEAYDHMAGFLHSRTLRWNYAGMKGREGDLFYRALAQEPMARQLDVMRRLGFAGIYLDRGGYADHGQAAVAELTALLGAAPSLVRADGEVVFFRLHGTAAPLPEGTAALDLMRKAGYLVGPMGKLIDASLADGIDFTRPEVPLFVRKLQGLSVPEPSGRWSDANVARTVTVTFREALPRRFVLKLSGRPFGPNLGKNITIRIDGRSYTRPIDADPFMLNLPVELASGDVRDIDIALPQPASPHELGLGEDRRRLGLLFERLSVASE